MTIFRTIKKDTILLKEGQKSNEGCFVLKGCIRTYYIIGLEENTTAFCTKMEGSTPHCGINKASSGYYTSCVEDTIVKFTNPYMEAESFNKFPKFESLCRVLSEELLATQ